MEFKTSHVDKLILGFCAALLVFLLIAANEATLQAFLRTFFE